MLQKAKPKGSGIADRIKPVSQLTSAPLKVLLYGLSGTGKTTVGATFPKPMLVLDFKDEGHDSVSDVGDDLKYLQCENWDDFEEAYWYIKKEGQHFKTIMLDTLTGLQNFVRLKVMEDDGRNIMTQPLHGEAGGLLKQWLGDYFELPVNLVLCAQPRTMRGSGGEDDDSNDEIVPSVGPDVQPMVQSFITAAMKVIGQTHIQIVSKKVKLPDNQIRMVKRPEYRLRLGPHPNYITKIRSPKGFVVPEFLPNPSYEAIMQVIRGEYKKGQKKDAEEQKPEV